MKARSGQNHDNKIAPQVNFNPTAANIMDMLRIFVIAKQYVFSVLLIIFSNKRYFRFNYRNNFFIHAMNYFSVVLIFLLCIKNFFFNWAENDFSRYREFIFWSTMLCGPCIWSGLVRVFDFLGRPFWKLCKWRSAFKENAKAKHCQGSTDWTTKQFLWTRLLKYVSHPHLLSISLLVHSGVSILVLGSTGGVLD